MSLFSAKNLDLKFSVLSGIFLAIGFSIQLIFGLSIYVIAIYLISYFFGAYFLIEETIRHHAKFDIDLLMLLAAIGAAILGHWAEGALLLFLFSLGHSLEHYAFHKARISINNLAKMSPKKALVRRANKEMEVPVEDLEIGDVVLIRPNTIVAADGRVIKGTSSVNQALITGESMPVDKFAAENIPETTNLAEINAEQKVFAGTMNGQGYLEVKVCRLAKDSTICRVAQMIKEAEENKAPTQLFTEKFEKIFVPSVLTVVFLMNFAFLVLDETFAESFYRAISVMVVASPCALVISTPSAVLSALAKAAKEGVLLKGGSPMDALASIKVIAMDKTGTLTTGEPVITDLIMLNNHPANEVAAKVKSLEAMSDHPLAKSIVSHLDKSHPDAPLYHVEKFSSHTGKGVSGYINNDFIRVGKTGLYEEKSLNPGITEQIAQLEKNGKTTVLIAENDKYIGLLGLRDEPRPESTNVISRLKSLNIERIVMLSGDNQNVVSAVAAKSGITEAWGDLMPDEKLDAIGRLNNETGPVAMVGDGVNDAPAMAKSAVGIAMGAAGSDVALETADVALMANSLDKLPFVIDLSRKAKKVIRQNIFISLGVISVMVPLTILGLASIGPAVLVHEGSTVLVVFNALRILSFKVR